MSFESRSCGDPGELAAQDRWIREHQGDEMTATTVENYMINMVEHRELRSLVEILGTQRAQLAARWGSLDKLVRNAQK